LEHLGLEYYGQPPQPNAEQDTMAEFNRILKPNGKLLMQVPYAKETTIVYHKSEQFYRTYTEETLQKLIGTDFNIINMTFYARGERCWMEINNKVANRIKQGSGFPVCLCYLEVVKR